MFKRQNRILRQVHAIPSLATDLSFQNLCNFMYIYVKFKQSFTFVILTNPKTESTCQRKNNLINWTFWGKVLQRAFLTIYAVWDRPRRPHSSYFSFPIARVVRQFLIVVWYSLPDSSSPFLVPTFPRVPHRNVETPVKRHQNNLLPKHLISNIRVSQARAGETGDVYLDTEL